MCRRDCLRPESRAQNCYVAATKLADAVSLVNQSVAVLGNKPATVVANASSVQVKGSC